MHDEEDARAGGAARTRGPRPPSVLVCETSAGALVLQGVPDGPIAYVAPDDSVDLRLALDAAFADVAHPVGAAAPAAVTAPPAPVDPPARVEAFDGPGAFRPADWFAARPGDRPIDRWEADVAVDPAVAPPWQP